MLPDQVTAQLLAELLGIGALAVAILWQPRHRCRWEHCPHHGKTVREEIRLDRELQEVREREGGRSDSDR
jgi:fatty acid desaturase